MTLPIYFTNGLILGDIVLNRHSKINRDSISDYAQTCRQMDVLSRSGLEQSFRILRKSHPSLALIVQNILNQAPIVKPAEFSGDPRTDNFLVDLQAEQIQSILHALISLADTSKLRKINGNVTELGNLVIVKTLIQDWVLVANAHILKTVQKLKSVKI